jgi:hypothetical protein
MVLQSILYCEYKLDALRSTAQKNRELTFVIFIASDFFDKNMMLKMLKKPPIDQ